MSKNKSTVNKSGKIIKPKTLSQKNKSTTTRIHNKISGKTKIRKT